MTKRNIPRRHFRSLQAYLKGPPRRSQRWLALKVGVNQSTISLLARGMRAPSARTLSRLSQITGIPVQALLNVSVRSHYVRPHEEARRIPDDDLDDGNDGGPALLVHGSHPL